MRSARAAFDSGVWSRTSAAHRKRVLQRLAELITEHSHELALLDSMDMGKLVVEAHTVDVPSAADLFAFYGEALDKINGEITPTEPGSLALVTREPLGVIGAVTPWNFPLDLAVWKVAPALAAGNSVVLKPAEQAPLSSLRLAELVAEAGVPEGVLNVVPGLGHIAGEALGRHPDVDVIAFTGSGETGKRFLRYAADSNAKQVWLECGGKSPNLVFADADLDAAVDKATSARSTTRARCARRIPAFCCIRRSPGVSRRAGEAHRRGDTRQSAGPGGHAGRHRRRGPHPTGARLHRTGRPRRPDPDRRHPRNR